MREFYTEREQERISESIERDINFEITKRH